MSTKKSPENKRALGRPPKFLEEVQKVHLEIEKSTLDQLDVWVDDLRSEVQGGRGIARADLIRDILRRAVEERKPAPLKKRKG